MGTRRLRGAIVIATLIILAAPLHAATPEEILKEFPITFEGLTADKFQAVPSIPDAYSASVDVPGLGPVNAYVYNTSSPTVAVTLPSVPKALSYLTDPIGIEILSPVMFWVKTDGPLETAAMPEALRNFVTKETGLTPSAKALKGVNLFGKFKSGGPLKSLNLPEACLGFGTKGEDPKAKTTLVTLVIPPGAKWEEPFNLPNTTIETGVVIIRSTGGATPKTDVESWATAALKGAAHDFTMYAKHDGTRLTNVGFDTASASLKDVVAVLGAFGTTLSLPEIPTPPEQAVKLSNDNVQSYNEGARPDFSKMMFQASLTGDASSSVNVNAKGELFNLNVAEVELHASAGGVYLSIPASCPLRPVGLKADLTKMTATEIPVTGELKDCYSGAIVDAANAVAHASVAGANAVADATTTAAGLAEEAAVDVGSYTAKRAEVWGNAIAQSSAAATAADQAKKLVESLQGDIEDLNDDIKSLEKDIKNLLRKLWAFVSGDVKELRAKKSHKRDKRDRKRTQLANALKLQAQAKDTAAKTTGAPFVDDFIENTQNLLAATAQKEVQEALKTYAASITGEEIVAEVRAMSAAGKLDPRAGFPDPSESLTLADAVKSQSSLPEAVASQAVASLIEKKTEQLLRDAVAKLPTMAYDVPVRIVSGSGLGIYVDGAKELGGNLRASVQGDNGEKEQFIFHTDGTVESVFAAGRCLSNFDKRPICDERCGSDRVTRVFFDPITGQLRALTVSSDGKPRALCMQIPQRPATSWTECGAASTSFTLVRADAGGSGLRSLSASPFPASQSTEEGTNLDPLSLPPMEP